MHSKWKVKRTTASIGYSHLFTELKVYVCVCVKSLSRVRLCYPFTIARQVLLSMGFSRQEYWSGLSFPSPGGLPYSGIEPRSLASKVDSLPSEPPGKPRVEGMYALIFEDA